MIYVKWWLFCCAGEGWGCGGLSSNGVVAVQRIELAQVISQLREELDTARR